MAIDLVRQIEYLISNGIYHNDIKCENIVVLEYNNSFYINLIDFGICKSINDDNLSDYLFTTYTSYSPEYFKININIKNKITKINKLKHLLDKSTHWIISGIIIDILCWKHNQHNIWLKYYSSTNHLTSINEYNNIGLCYEYVKDILNIFIQLEDLYIDKLSLNANILEISSKINKQNLITTNIFEITMGALTNMTYYKQELSLFVSNIFNMLEYETDKKKDLSTIYNEINTYPGYLEYIKLKNKFI